MKKSIVLSVLIIALFCFYETNAQKTESLFNGKDLSNWNFVVDKNSVPSEKVFSVRDSVICINGTLGYMYTKKKYENYVLHVEYRWPKEASNSGIFLSIEDPKNPFPNGIECQLAHGKAGDLVLLGGSDLYEYKAPPTGRPAFPVIDKARETNEKPVGEWNHANIFVQDGVITVFINGAFMNKGTNKVKNGYIGLQSEGKDIEFRNVTVSDL